MKAFGCAILLFLAVQSPGPATAQSGDWVETGAPRLEASGYLRLREMALSPDSRLLDQARREIKELLTSGRVSGDDPAIVELLSETSLGPSLRRGSVNRLNDPSFFPSNRVAWIDLLSLLSARQALPIALGIIKSDEDPDVLEAAYRALRNIGEDPGRGIDVYYRKHLLLGTVNSPHEPLVIEILTGLHRRHERGFDTSDRDLFEAVYLVSQDTRLLRQTRGLAQSLLKKMLGLDL